MKALERDIVSEGLGLSVIKNKGYLRSSLTQYWFSYGFRGKSSQ